jgi:hypothetical protein
MSLIVYMQVRPVDIHLYTKSVEDRWVNFITAPPPLLISRRAILTVYLGCLKYATTLGLVR